MIKKNNSDKYVVSKRSLYLLIAMRLVALLFSSETQAESIALLKKLTALKIALGGTDDGPLG